MPLHPEQTTPLAIVAPLGDLRLRTRLLKFAERYAEDGFALSHIGWSRAGERSLPDDPPWMVEHVLTGGIYNGGTSFTSIRGYMQWVTQLVRWTRRARPQRAHCLGLESVVPLLLASIGRRTPKIVFDEADRLSLIRNWPLPLRVTIQMIERWAYRRVSLHLVPSRARYDAAELTRRAVELENVPTIATVQAALASAEEIPAAEDFVLFSAGWNSEIRGAGLMLAIAEACGSGELPGVRLQIAGRCSDETANRLTNHPSVEYLGELPQQTVLALASKASCMLTFYDPVLPINRVAVANKWGDAIGVGVPFIVNNEVVTARPYVEEGIAFGFDFASESDLIGLVRRLQTEPHLLTKACSAASERLERTRRFEDVVREEILPVLA